MTSLLENLSFAVALPRVVRPNESLRCPTPSLKTPKTSSQQNKSQNRGVLFRPENTTAKTPRSPRVPPQLHHQKTTSNHHASPKTPCKNTKTPHPHHARKKTRKSHHQNLPPPRPHQRYTDRCICGEESCPKPSQPKPPPPTSPSRNRPKLHLSPSPPSAPSSPSVSSS